MKDFDKKWFLIKTKPNCENIAIKNLERQDFCLFRPLQRVTIKAKGKFKEVTKSLFPSYLFIALDYDSNDWRKINNTIGVSHGITFGDTKAKIDARIVTELKNRYNSSNKNREKPVFKNGQKIKINNGAFTELFAKIEETACSDRIWVLLKIMGHERRVSISSKQIENIEATKD